MLILKKPCSMLMSQEIRLFLYEDENPFRRFVTGASNNFFLAKNLANVHWRKRARWYTRQYQSGVWAVTQLGRGSVSNLLPFRFKNKLTDRPTNCACNQPETMNYDIDNQTEPLRIRHFPPSIGEICSPGYDHIWHIWLSVQILIKRYEPQ